MASTALRVPLAAPPCPACAGGGQVNGLDCRECGGSSRAAARPVRVRWRQRLAALADRAAVPAGRTVGTLARWSATVPGIGGAAALTWGSALVVHGVFGQVPVLGVALAVGGVFGLLADRRL